jgi:hypothetical protein
MRIPENAIPHSLTRHTSEDNPARLVHKGYKLLGEGAYSQVWAIPGCEKHVLKVGLRNDAWPEYIHYANWLGELGKKAPMVLSINQKRHHYFAVMERLIPVYGIHRFSAAINTAEWHEFRRKLNRQSMMFDVCEGDGNSQNIMARKNGELVLTDPWYGANFVREPFRFHNGQTHCLPDDTQRV